MKTYYVYILECSDDFLYTGVTNSIERRLNEHNRGLNAGCFTYNRRPLKLIFYEVFNDIEQAIWFEKKIKKWSRKKKKSLAEGNYDMLEILSECRNATHSKYKPNKK
jgi:putative endonuclease